MPDSEEEKTEKRKVEITKRKFIEGLEGYTSWDQVKNFIENSPAFVKTMIANDIQSEIDSFAGKVENITKWNDFLIELKTEIEAIGS